jgi:5-methylcytosine-specific restriction endonuclease McrA
MARRRPRSFTRPFRRRAGPSDAMSGSAARRVAWRRWKRRHPQAVADQLRRQDFRCHWCGRPLWITRPIWLDAGSHLRPTWDHLIPLAAGGTNARENLVLVCRTCNNDRTNVRTAWHPLLPTPLDETLALLVEWPPDAPIRCRCGHGFYHARAYHRHRKRLGWVGHEPWADPAIS